MKRYVADKVDYDAPYIQVSFDEGASMVRVPMDKLKVALQIRRLAETEKIRTMQLPTVCANCVADGAEPPYEGNLEAWFRSAFVADVTEVNGQIAYEWRDEGEVSYDLHWLQSISCNECGFTIEGPATALD